MKQKQKKYHNDSLLQDILHLGLKIFLITLCFVLVFIFIFGVFRNNELSMKPSIVGGDLVIYYRFDKNYVASDAVVVKYQGKFITSRVMAVAGDTVDISENGLIINGALQQEPEIRSATNLFSNKVKFPLTLGEGQVFLLGDNRANATDSRIFGPVNCSATYGKVITLLRRRNI